MKQESIFDRVAMLEVMVSAQAGMIADLQWRLTSRDEGKATLAEMARIIARRHRLKLADIRGPRRIRALTLARKEFCTEACGAGFTLEQIGEYLNRDHTTISHLAGRLSRAQQSEEVIDFKSRRAMTAETVSILSVARLCKPDFASLQLRGSDD